MKYSFCSNKQKMDWHHHQLNLINSENPQESWILCLGAQIWTITAIWARLVFFVQIILCSNQKWICNQYILHLIYFWGPGLAWSEGPAGTLKITEPLIKLSVFHHSGPEWCPRRAWPWAQIWTITVIWARLVFLFELFFVRTKIDS